LTDLLKHVDEVKSSPLRHRENYFPDETRKSVMKKKQKIETYYISSTSNKVPAVSMPTKQSVVET